METLRIPLGLFFLAMAWTLVCCAAEVRAGGLALKARSLDDSPARNRKLGRGLAWWLDFQRVVRRVA